MGKHFLKNEGLGVEPPRKFLIFELKLVEISWYVDNRINEECLEF